MSKVHDKLMQARIKLQNTKLKKSGLNKFAGYEYFELADFLPAVQTIFNEVGLCGVISFATDLATLTITDVEDGSNIVLTSPMADAPLKGCLPIQCMGAVETYTRRYLWVSAMEIVEHDQVDAVVHDVPKNAKPGMKYDAPKVPARPIVELPADEIEFMTEMKDSVISLCSQEKQKEALSMIHAAGLESEQRIWLDNQLDSKTRSLLKAAKYAKFLGA